MTALRKSDTASIYLSVGASNCSAEFIKRAVDGGADGFRLIAKGASPEKICEIYLKARRLVPDPSKLILDLPGTKPRLAAKVPTAPISPGTLVDFSLAESWPPTTTVTVGTINLSLYHKSIAPGDRLIVKVGHADFEVIGCYEDKIVTRYTGTRTIRLVPNRSINLPDCALDYQPLSAADKALLKLLPNDSTVCIAVSMVGSVKDIKNVQLLAPRAQIIPKIESKLAIENINAIIQATSPSGGVMLARGDLAIELSPVEVVRATILVTEKCRQYKRKLLLATWILYSLTFRELPAPDSLTDVLYFYQNGCRDFIISAEPAADKALESIRWLRNILNELAIK